MIKVCFTGTHPIMDSTSASRMYKEFIKLLERDSAIEFWFTGCHNDYEKTAVKYIRELKNEHPEKQIKLVAVIDPIKNEKYNLDDLDGFKTGFPRGSVDRIEYAPRIEGKCELNPHRFVEHFRKVFRWIVEQCDILIAYHYDGIPDAINTEIKRFRKKGTIEIISIYNPEIAEAIDLYIDKLDGRDKVVLQGLKSGRTYKSISEELNVSQNRVQQIATHAIRYMMKELRNKIYS